MRKLLLPAAAWAALVVAWPAAATTAPVQITRTGFVPSTTTITAGDTVSWTNADTSAHQVVANNGTFSSPVLQPGQSYSYTFRTAGKTQYHDAMQKNRKGTVVVNAPPASVTLRASRGAVVYGGGLTLSGVVSSQKAGEAVVVEMQECGKPTFTRLAAATTANGGAWSLAVKPATTTTYQARWKSVSSAPVTVKARPRVRLGEVATNRFSVRVSAAQSFAGKAVLFQRYNRARSSWVTVKRVLLRATGLGVAPTVVSARTFTAKVKRGAKLRAYMPRTQTAPCYFAARSNFIQA